MPAEGRSEVQLLHEVHLPEPAPLRHANAPLLQGSECPAHAELPPKVLALQTRMYPTLPLVADKPELEYRRINAQVLALLQAVLAQREIPKPLVDTLSQQLLQPPQ